MLLRSLIVEFIFNHITYSPLPQLYNNPAEFQYLSPCEGAGGNERSPG